MADGMLITFTENSHKKPELRTVLKDYVQVSFPIREDKTGNCSLIKRPFCT